MQRRRLKMLRPTSSGSSDKTTNQSVGDRQQRERREERLVAPPSDSRRGGVGHGRLGKLFRRNKSAPCGLSDSDPDSKTFSDRTQSTLSMSLTSRGGEDVLYRASGRSHLSQLRKSEILKELSDELEEDESDDEAPVEEVVRPPPTVGEAPYILKKHEYASLGYMQFHSTSLLEAREIARDKGKPLFVVHTELPGDEDVCQEIFSHPLVVEAARSLFVTVLCIEEAASDAPVIRASSGRRCRATVRLLAATWLQEEVLPALRGDTLTRKCVVNAMIQTLEGSKKPVPKYLQIMPRGECATTGGARAVFGTHDLGRAEIEFSSLDGVVATKAAILNCHGVIAVEFDPRRCTYSRLVRHAVQEGLCNIIFFQGNKERIAVQVELSRVSASPVVLPLQGDLEKDHQSKQALRGTAMRFVPESGLQASWANRLIHEGRFNEAMHLLSPHQGQMLMQAMRAASEGTLFELIDVPILSAWRSVCEQEHPCTFEPQPSTEAEFYNSDNEQIEL